MVVAAVAIVCQFIRDLCICAGLGGFCPAFVKAYGIEEPVGYAELGGGVKESFFSELGGKHSSNHGAIDQEEVVDCSDDNIFDSFDQCIFMS
jgi:hypothetical protein